MVSALDVQKAMHAIARGLTLEQSGLPINPDTERMWSQLADEMAAITARGGVIMPAAEIADGDEDTPPDDDDPDPDEEDDEPDPEIDASTRYDMPLSTEVQYPSMIGVSPHGQKRRKRRPRKYKGVSLSRRPTDFEAFVLSLSDIPTRFDQEIARTVDEIVDARRDQLQGDIEERSMSTRTATDRAIENAKMRIGRYGAYELRQECARQGLGITVYPEDHRTYRSSLYELSSVGDTPPGQPLHDEWMMHLRDCARRARRARKPDSVTELAEARIDWGLKTAVRACLNESFALSRRAHMRLISAAAKPTDVVHLRAVNEAEADRLVDYVIQTAVLDTNTCEPCEDADGRTFDYDDDEMLEHQPPYYKCHGGDRCRCVQVYVLKDGSYWVVRDDEILNR